MTATVESVDVDSEVLTELILEIDPLRTDRGSFIDRLTDIAAAAFNEDWAFWRAAPVGTANGMSYATFVSVNQLVQARAVRDDGKLQPAYEPGFIKIGTFAHYAARDGLTAATVEGHPVEALCGYWFVPMHDHEELSVCPICEGAAESLES